MKWVNREDEALDAGFQNFKELLDKEYFWINAEYAKNYARLKNILSKDDLMLLYFEDFRKNPIQKLYEVQDFLGIKAFEIESNKLNRKINKTKSFDLPDEWNNYMKHKLS